MRQSLVRVDSADAQALRTSVLADVRSRTEQTQVNYEARLAQLQLLLAHTDTTTTTRLPPGSSALPPAGAGRWPPARAATGDHGPR